MKITICGSIAFFDEMLAIKEKLQQLGHEVDLPPLETKDENGQTISIKEFMVKRKTETDNQSWVWDRKEESIRMHFEKIDWADVVLILNYSKKEIANYIGANTLIEMGLAFYLHKKIFLLNPIPEISYKEEILAMKPIVINGDLNKIE